MESRKHLKKSFSLCIQYHEKSWDNKIRVILHNNFKILDFQTALKIKIVAQTSAPQQFFFFLNPRIYYLLELEFIHFVLIMKYY
jgi:hypothetical protein